MKLAIVLAILLPRCLLAGEADFRLELRLRALRYFVDHANPVTGLVRDRARNFGPTPDRGDYRVASLAATGFGISVMSDACRGKLLDCGIAQATIERALDFSLSHLDHYHGWFYHFVDWRTGVRYGDSEISTVDTAWFLAGALHAALVFPNTRIATLAKQIYERVDFLDMMTDGGKLPAKRTLSMGWTPEGGYLGAEWNSYAEQMFLILLGLAHPTRPLPAETWSAWKRPKLKITEGYFLIGPELPLFAHQYTQVFLDLRHFHDRSGNYHFNSQLASLRDRKYCRESNSFETFRAGFWGLSASDSPDGYKAFSLYYHNGTVCPACAGASALFDESLIHDLEKWTTGKYSAKIWGQYGFIDSLNLDRNWYDEDVIGITVGTLYLALADLEGGSSPWRAFATYAPIQKALRIAAETALPNDVGNFHR